MTPLLERVALFAGLLLWCGVLIVFRAAHTSTELLRYLFWNLFLAAIPAIAAAFFARHRRSGALRVALFVIWLLFLPNAPYILTDFVHLVPQPPVPLWYDIALLASCAGTGLLLGYASVADVQATIARDFGRRTGWAVASGALLLSGAGIYVGRFLRWNSWDAVTRPHELASYVRASSLDPFEHRRGIGVTLIYGTFLLLGYIALQVFAQSFARRDEGRRRQF